MQHNELLNKELIAYNTDLNSKEEIFDKIASLAIGQGIARDKKTIVNGLYQREQESTTGFFDGFAIPHTKQSTITEPGIVILVNNEGIEWDSMDGKPARFFISLLIPEQEAGSTHLKMLSSISKMLMQEEIRTELLNAGGSDEIYDMITNFLKENMN